MQYILSEEEMAKFRAFEQDARTLSDILAKQPSEYVLQDICTRAADEWPTYMDWQDNLRPWGCILSTNHEHYCDKCPVQKICPYPHKEWSK